MKLLSAGCWLLCLVSVSGCSMTPDRPITRKELYNTQIFTEFAVKDSVDSILATLNREGEVVLLGKDRYGIDYFIKVLATSQGLRLRLYQK